MSNESNGSNGNELDSLILELKKTTGAAKSEAAKTEETLTEDTLMPFILAKLQELINSGLASVKTVKDTIQTAVDAEEVQSYAGLVNAVSSALDTLMKISLQNKKTEAAIKLKQLGAGDDKKPKGGTQVFIATREEVVGKFLKDIRRAEEAPILELEDS